MASPSNMDFPIPSRSSITSLPGQLNFENETLNPSRLLSLVHRYRSQAITLVAKQEALLAEQKRTFDLERELWNTEREIWEEERRILNTESHQRRESFAVVESGSSQMINGDETGVSINAKSFGDSTTNGTGRRRESSGGGSGIAWFLKQGRQPSGTDSVTSVEELLVSPKDSITNLKPRPAVSAPSSQKPAGRSWSQDNDADEGVVDDEDFNQLSPSLLAEASRIVYGDRREKRRPSSSLLSPGPSRPTLVTSLSANVVPQHHDLLSGLGIQSNDSSTSQLGGVKHNYLASASESDSDNEEEEEEVRPEKTNEKFDIPLRLKQTTNFGAEFGTVRPVNVRKRSRQDLRKRDLQHERGRSITSVGVGKTSFYDPETPVRQLRQQHQLHRQGLAPFPPCHYRQQNQHHQRRR